MIKIFFCFVLFSCLALVIATVNSNKHISSVLFCLPNFIYSSAQMSFLSLYHHSPGKEMGVPHSMHPIFYQFYTILSLDMFPQPLIFLFIYYLYIQMYIYKYYFMQMYLSEVLPQQFGNISCICDQFSYGDSQEWRELVVRNRTDKANEILLGVRKQRKANSILRSTLMTLGNWKK